MTPKGIKRGVVFGVLSIVALILGLNTIYIVPEGHVAVVNYTGKAVRQEEPGLQFKNPILESYVTFEVRERKSQETLAASTGNQLPATAIVSINWTVNRSAAIDLYRQYGGIEQFEDRVLNPRMRSAAKAAIAHFRADQIIRDRQLVVADIFAEIQAVTADLPISISTAQLEDITLPSTYMDSILAKEKAREDAEREKHSLVQQKLVAQQKVQTAEAKRDAIKAVADGNAYSVRVAAEAESFRILTEYTGRSEGVDLLAAQLTPEYIEYLRAQGWDGRLPTTMLSKDSEVLYGIGTGVAPVMGVVK
jgi:regulator of protease activity HflC (stomatin/prohibitin superfamily)